jgi:hypothetical protein
MTFEIGDILGRPTTPFTIGGGGVEEAIGHQMEDVSRDVISMTLAHLNQRVTNVTEHTGRYVIHSSSPSTIKYTMPTRAKAMVAKSIISMLFSPVDIQL